MVAVVIPCYKVRDKILDVLADLGREIDRVFVVDDACPEHTGDHVKKFCVDPRVSVLYHPQNKGVGGAVITGYRAALQEGADIVLKMDGDGQMDAKKAPLFIAAIRNGQADYVKGNRFYSWEMVSSMPKTRLMGNGMLSFMSKLVSGYWSIMDPTNGYTAISGRVLNIMPLEKLDNGYFFESDFLFRLGTVRAVVIDLPLIAIYKDEKSSLNIMKTIFHFPPKFSTRFFKRMIYSYFLRDFNIGSLFLISGVIFTAAGVGFGINRWMHALTVPTTSGTVMLAALPILVGFQCFIQFISYDIVSEPRKSLHNLLQIWGPKDASNVEELSIRSASSDSRRR